MGKCRLFIYRAVIPAHFIGFYRAFHGIDTAQGSFSYPVSDFSSAYRLQPGQYTK
jgi:hypothetical protein